VSPETGLAGQRPHHRTAAGTGVAEGDARAGLRL